MASMLEGGIMLYNSKSTFFGFMLYYISLLCTIHAKRVTLMPKVLARRTSHILSDEVKIFINPRVDPEN